ncbi:FAD-dependent monooxygenase [Gymnodinialimonas ceratoperidinii]|uniref:FAD-dependent monooxygenase n=2 Tax=Gymnodinialimonas ceratoperidinii TaxID=2856823 RepID=A0A8F6TYR2_9RHOB|nr:FAD-dependent monooxygenase [Gymnodinialimonas ceratoperidinii]
MKMKIAIAGAGIGGLSAASLLAGDGHVVQVFDQFEAPRPVGSGLVIQPVGMEVLQACGAAEEALTRGTPILHMHGDEARSRKVVLSVSYGATPQRQGLGIHRAALFTALFEAAERAGARITPSSPVTGRHGQHLLIGGRRTGPFDLIVDALGARSPLSPLKARALPYGAVWATVPWPEGAAFPRDHLTQRYRKADRMLGILPIGTRRDAPETRLAAVFYSLPVADIEQHFARPFAQWRAEAAQLWPEFESYLPAAFSHADFTPAHYTHGTLRRPYGEGLVHIGDAAHRASPQLGQGANMALLDAHALHLALRGAQGRTEEALRHYALARRAHVRLYQAFSAAFTPQYQSDSAALPMLRDHVLAPLSRTWPLPRVLTRLVCGDLVPPMAALTPRSRG